LRDTVAAREVRIRELESLTRHSRNQTGLGSPKVLKSASNPHGYRAQKHPTKIFCQQKAEFHHKGTKTPNQARFGAEDTSAGGHPNLHFKNGRRGSTRDEPSARFMGSAALSRKSERYHSRRAQGDRMRRMRPRRLQASRSRSPPTRMEHTRFDDDPAFISWRNRLLRLLRCDPSRQRDPDHQQQVRHLD